MLNKDELLQFNKDGYIIKPILSASKIDLYLNIIHNHIKQNNDKMFNIQFIQPKMAIKGIQSIINNNKIIEICSHLLKGGDIILDGASLFYANKGGDYRQGWHRDVIQIPDEEILDSWYSDKHFHNNIQINIPLYKDECLWFVKGSHIRNFNNIEKALFSGSKKIAPMKSPDINIGEKIILNPGEAIFYNNLAIHRGYGGILKHNRATIQLGYHTNRCEPTCHFGVMDYKKFDDDYIKSLDLEVKNMLYNHVLERKKWDKSEYYYNLHQDFIKKEFDINILGK